MCHWRVCSQTVLGGSIICVMPECHQRVTEALCNQTVRACVKEWSCWQLGRARQSQVTIAVSECAAAASGRMTLGFGSKRSTAVRSLT
jgi:hypothetical protein